MTTVHTTCKYHDLPITTVITNILINYAIINCRTISMRDIHFQIYYFRAADDINDNSNDKVSINDRNKRKDKKFRKKHNDESFNLEPNVDIKEEKLYLESKINSSGKKEHIKVEPDSENEVRKKRKKIKTLEMNGDHNDSQESMSYDETYLNMKVKQEDSLASCSTKHKKKKRKRTSSIDSSTTPVKSYDNNNCTEMYDDNVILKEETENDSEMNNTKKKKKKKKRHNSDNQNLAIEEKMEIKETVVNQNSKGNYSNRFATNKTLQEESEESGCDEISAIKCDDSHSPHTISFINNSIDEENMKVNNNNSLNISTKLPEQDSNKILKAAEHRKQRISDRIRFEDDEDDINTESSHIEHESHSENNKKPLKLQNFIKTHPNLKPLSQTFNTSPELTPDDEIWILKCPTELNIKDFDKTTLNIHGKCKIKVSGQTYEGSAEEEQSDIISLLTMEQNKYKIRNVPLCGIINLRKRIPKAHFRDDNIMVNNQTNFIPLPETKCRHPLFGSNYKKALKIPAAIAERLNVQDTEDSLARTSKRKHKKDKKERNALELNNIQAQIDITMKPEPELPIEKREKKKKKRKMVDDEVPTPKKAKRIKHDPDSAEAWESEKAIEENLFNF